MLYIKVDIFPSFFKRAFRFASFEHREVLSEFLKILVANFEEEFMNIKDFLTQNVYSARLFVGNSNPIKKEAY